MNKKNIFENEAEHLPYEVLIKLKPGEKSKIPNKNINDIKAKSLKQKLEKFKAKKIKKIAKEGKKSKKSARIFDWYLIELDKNQPLSFNNLNGNKYYHQLEEIESQLLNDPSVEAVSKNYLVEADVIPNDSYYSSNGSWGQSFDDLWGLKKISSEAAWDTTTGSSDVVVAVIDTGIDKTHTEIDSKIWVNDGEINNNGIDDDGNGYIDDYNGWNWVADNNNPEDDHGHGTHVSGTISAESNNSTGITGVSWSSTIMPLKFLGSSGSGYTAHGVAALVYAADMGADVANNSWGCACPDDPLINDAIAYVHDLNVVPVVAAGNHDRPALNYAPAASDGAITVAASDDADTIADFSNHGSRIDVIAPGVEILSLRAANAKEPCLSENVVGADYCYVDGTSMAAPHVSGLVALLLANNPNLSVEQVRQILRSTATDLGYPGRDGYYGYGRIDAGSAVSGSSTPEVLTPIITSPSSRETIGGNLDLIGSANGTDFAEYKIVAEKDRNFINMSTTLATYSTPVSNGVLHSIDTTTLADGQYAFTVSVTTSDGDVYEYSIHDITIDNFEAEIVMPHSFMAITSDVPIIGTVEAKGSLGIDYFVLEYGEGANPSSWNSSGITLTNGGTQSVINDTLAIWDTSGLTNGTTYTLRLTAYATNGSSYQITKLITPESRLLPGWPQRLEGNGTCEILCTPAGPLFADLDLDGNQEIIVPAYNNQIFAYHKDGSVVEGFPVSFPSGEYFTNPPVAADMDGDLKPEIIVNSVSGQNDRTIYIIKGDGAFYPGWTQPEFYSRSSLSANYTPSVADIDNDGQNEIVTIINAYPGGSFQMHAMHADGTYLAGYPINLTGSGINIPWTMTPLAIDDLNNDGQKEIIYATREKVYIFNPSGSVLDGWPITLPLNGSDEEITNSTPAVGDVNGDGQKEILIVGEKYPWVNESNRVYAYTIDGSLLSGWPHTASTPCLSNGQPWYSPTTADIDNDGKDEVITGRCDMSVIDHETGKRALPETNAQPQVSIADFEGDGTEKFPGFGYWDYFTWVDEDFSVYWSGSAHNRSWFDFITFRNYLVSDLDNNGQQEFAGTYLYESDELIYLYEMPGVTSPIDSWPMSQHDAAHTSHYEVGQATNDLEPPIVVIADPPEGAVVSGAVSIDVNAVDNEGIDHVDFFVNGSSIGTDSDFPYSLVWDTSIFNPGGYSLTAKAVDTSSNETTSEAVTVTIPDTSPPSTPANLRLDNSNATSLEFSWDASTDDVGVAGYKIYRNGTLISTQSIRSFTDNGRQPETSYDYAVLAYDAADNESGTANATFTTDPDTSAPSVPSGIGASNVTATSQRISWNASTDNVGVTGYEIFRNSSLIGTSAVTYFDDTNLQPLTAYNYTVRAFDAASNLSAHSASYEATTAADTTAPSAPINGQVVNNTITSQRIQWDASNDDVAVLGYKIYYSGELLADISSTQYDHTGLDPGQAYTYTVEAYDAAGNVSARSSDIFGTTALDIEEPTVTIISPLSNSTLKSSTTIKASANDNHQVKNIKIYRGSKLLKSFSNSIGSYIWNTKLIKNGTYNIRAVASDPSGNTSTKIVTVRVSNPKKTYRRGDVNKDGKVNIYDLSLLLTNWRRKYSPADFNNNGSVDIFDLSVLLYEYVR